MTSRALTLARACLPAILLLVLICGPAIGPAGAATPYDYADGHEGDPGDGVLDPAVDGGDGAGSRKDRSAVPSGAGYDAVWPAGDSIAVRLVLPMGGSMRPVVILLPRAWLVSGPWDAFPAGRSPHAP